MRITDALILKNVHLQPIVNGGLDVMKGEKVHRMQEFSQSELNKCRDEKLKLQAVVADLKQVNRRWQTYNNDMQVFIKRLQSTIQDQQEQLNNMADKQAERLPLTNKEDDHRDTSCLKCEPVIEYLRKRICRLEDELSVMESHQSYSAFPDQSSEILSLQLRLRQAYEHIHHLNRIMQNSGILKTGYNVLPQASRSHSVRPCSLDGLKFFECDNESVDTDSITSKNIRSGSDYTNSRPDSPSTSWEDARDETEHISSTEKSFVNTTNSKASLTPLNISDKCFKDSYDFCTSEKSNFDGSLIDLSESAHENFKIASKENTREVDYSVKIPPDRLNMNLHDESQSTSNSGKFDLSPINDTSRFKALETNYYPPLTDSSYRFLNSSIDSTNSSQYGSTSKLDLSLSSDDICSTSPLRKTSKYWDEDYIGQREFHQTHSPITCPHCHTVFPPDLKEDLSQHLISCQYL